MKLSTFFSVIVFAATAPMALQSSASTASICDTHHVSSGDGLIFSNSLSAPLTSGSYQFAGAHRAGATFFEELTFSLPTTSNVSIDLTDVTLSIPTLGNSSAAKLSSLPVFSNMSFLSNLLGNKYLTFSLFDNAGQLLGSAGAGTTLTALNLAANDYVLTVSGRASGVLGGVYTGNLAVTAVPIGDTAPLLGSALLMLMMRSRKQRAIAGH